VLLCVCEFGLVMVVPIITLPSFLVVSGRLIIVIIE
jgi:hypothetical protein